MSLFETYGMLGLQREVAAVELLDLRVCPQQGKARE